MVLCPLHRLQIVPDPIDIVKDLLGILKYDLTGRGQLHSRLEPVEKRMPQIGFKLPDLDAD